MFSYLSQLLSGKHVVKIAKYLLVTIATAAGFSHSVYAERTLITNINGYHYAHEAPEIRLRPQRMTAKPRQGYWANFSAMLIDDNGRIEKIYSQAPALDEFGSDKSLIIINGKGKTVLPGIIDAHVHLLSLGQRYQRVDLVGSKSVQDAQNRVAVFAKTSDSNDWILGRGWNQVLWPEKVFPTASALDEVESKRPVFLNRIDGHAGWANTAALKSAGITAFTEDPQGGKIIRDKGGKPTGVLIDTAMSLVEKIIPAPSEASIREALKFAQDELRALGITSVHDAGVDAALADLYKELAENNALSVRIYAMISGAEGNLAAFDAPWISVNDDMLSIRSVKLYADGALGSRGAALLKPYSDQPDHNGLLFNPYDGLRAQIELAASRGFQVNVHAIGDAANRQVLDIFAQLPKVRHKLRHRIEHSQIIALDDLARFKELDIIASMQPTHATSDMNMAEDRLGKERIKGAYAWRRLLDLGVLIAGGSDFPVELSNPYHGLYAAVSRKDRDGNPENGWYPDQAMNRAEALRAFTIDAAFAAHQESRLGNLQPGYWADFIMLEQDFFTMPENEIHALEVQETWLKGICVYKR